MKIIEDWLCAECLRKIAGGSVRIASTNEILMPEGIPDALKNHGTKEFMSVVTGRIYLFAVTVVNGEYRCVIHV